MTHDEVMQELKQYGNEGTKTVLMNHGAQEPFFGVKVGDMKKIVKKIKKNHELSLSLYATKNSDAMYLAGLIADESKLSKATLQSWAKDAYWYMLSTYTVPNVAAETPFGLELALEWIESDEEQIANAGWSTLSVLCALKKDEDLDIALFERYLLRAKQEVHTAKNRVRYAMNAYIISVGSYIYDLTGMALEIGNKIGKVDVNMGNTACKVPQAGEYIQKVLDRGTVGKKRRTMRC